MANSINQRLGLNGLDEVRRGLAAVASEGQQSGNTIRQALLAATGATQPFGNAVQGVEVSARATRYAIQNLTFQINDVVTSLASGISPFRTFTQQGGQFVQLFQQGGGIGNVIGGFTSRMAALITPTRLAVAGLATLGAGFAALAIRAENSQVSARRFDTQLQIIGKSSIISGKELEDAAKRMGDVGLSADEARTKLHDFISAGGDPRFAERVVRGAADLSAVLGKSTGEAFSEAAASGSVEVLQGIAKRLNIPIGDATKSIFKDFTEENRRLNFELQDLVFKRNHAILENERRTRQQIRDLTRERGTEKSFPGLEDVTQRKEILVQSARQEEEIRRQSEYEQNEILRLAARQRNEENRKALQEYNANILAEAVKAGEAQRLMFAITEKVSGAEARLLGPLGTAIQHLTVEWNKFLDALTKSGHIVEVIHQLERFTAWVVKLQAETGLPGIVLAITAVSLVLLPFITAIKGLVALLSIEALPITIPLLAIGAAILVMTGNAQKLQQILAAIGLAPAPNTQNNNSNTNQPMDVRDLESSINSANRAVAGGLGDVSVPTVFSGVRGNKAGGLFRGPGTGTSDSILARVSDGEFLVNAAATRMNLPLLQAINSMSRPILGAARGFAAGGLVTAAAGSGRDSFTLVIEGQSYGGLSAPAKTAKEMIQYARTSSLMRAGKTPSWNGAG